MGGAVLEVSWGYPGLMARPRRVVVKNLKGFTTLNIEGQALSALMNKEQKTRMFENMSRAQAVRQIAAENGYEGVLADIQDTDEVFEVINQTAETDARFIRRLAAREEFEFYVDESGFHFHERRQNESPTHVFTWYADPGRGDILSIDVESDLVKRTGKVAVRGRDPLTRTTIDTIATNDTVDRSTLGDVLEVVDPETGDTAIETRNATLSIHATAATTQKRAARESSARFRRAERATIKLSMKVVGDPTLSAKRIVEVRGISALLSGKYYVTEVKHSVSSSGYTCDLKLTKDGGGRSARPKAREQKGEKNTTKPRNDGQPTQFEIIDPETGTTFVEYRSDGQRFVMDDPEE
jgi:phage protein D